VLAGSDVTYTVVVINNSATTALSPTVSDALPPGTTFLSESHPGTWNCTDPAVGAVGTLSCTKASLTSAEGSQTFTLVVHVSPTATGPVSNTATVSATNDATARATATTTVGCDRDQPSATGTVRLLAGTTCIRGATIGGSLIVPAGASVVVVDSTIRGSLTATKPGSVSVCDSTVGGRARISRATGFVLLGDPGDDICAGNTFRSSVTLSSNHGGLDVGANNITGNTSVTRTDGVGPFPDDVGAEIVGNTIGGRLTCSRNSSVTNDGPPNSHNGTGIGQCAGL